MFQTRVLVQVLLFVHASSVICLLFIPAACLLGKKKKIKKNSVCSARQKHIWCQFDEFCPFVIIAKLVSKSGFSKPCLHCSRASERQAHAAERLISLKSNGRSGSLRMAVLLLLHDMAVIQFRRFFVCLFLYFWSFIYVICFVSKLMSSLIYRSLFQSAVLF